MRCLYSESVLNLCLVRESKFLFAKKTAAATQVRIEDRQTPIRLHREATESPPIASRASGSTPGPPTPLGKSVGDYRRAIRACTLTFRNDRAGRAGLEERNPRRCALPQPQRGKPSWPPKADDTSDGNGHAQANTR